MRSTSYRTLIIPGIRYEEGLIMVKPSTWSAMHRQGEKPVDSAEVIEFEVVGRNPVLHREEALKLARYIFASFGEAEPTTEPVAQTTTRSAFA